MGKLTSVYIRGNLNIVLQRRNGRSDLFHGKENKRQKKEKKQVITSEVITALKMYIF